MKRALYLLLTVTFLAGNVMLHAKAVDQSEVRRAAEAFLQKHRNIAPVSGSALASGSIISVDALSNPQGGETLAYIVHLSPQGFLVLSADTDIQPVLAYSFRHNWEKKVANSDFYRFVAKDIALRKAALPYMQADEQIRSANQKWQTLMQQSPATALDLTFRQWPEPGMTTSGGWVETAWLQIGTPFNDFCPDSLLLDSIYGDRGAVGCVATAMAQVVNYHGYIGDLSFGAEDAYVTRSQGIGIDADSTDRNFPSFHQLNKYLDTLRMHYESEAVLTNNDIAALNFACGISVQMDYDVFGSGAYSDDVSVALLNKFGYASARNVGSSDSLYTILKSNMMNGWPATLSIQASDFCVPGHVVVCDGYNTDGYYHLNFGWGDETPDAITDAWYFLPEGMPDGYDVIVDANVDIRPPALPAVPLAIIPGVVDLGGVAVDSYSAAKSFSVKNTGNEVVTVTLSTLSPNFEVGFSQTVLGASLEAFQLNAGEVRQLYVRCRADTQGVFSGNALFKVAASEDFFAAVDFACIGVPANGTAVKGGPVSGVWTRENSPYYICGDISVEWPGGLRIEPGVEVIFMGKFKLSKEGGAEFQAVGTKEDSIRFCAADTSIGWYGLDIAGGEKPDSLVYCVLTGGRGDGAHPQNTGGALTISSSNVVISHCRISHNFAFNGGGIYIAGKDAGMGPMLVKVSNTLICDNRSTSMGGGVTVSGGFSEGSGHRVVFENVTFANNQTGKMGGALAMHMESYVQLKNCIIWHNYADFNGKVIDMGNDNHGITGADTLVLDYCDIDTTLTEWLGHGDVQGVVDWRDGNIVAAPLFTDAAACDYTLQSGSPCIDAGDPAEECNDVEDPNNSGSAWWPALGTLRNDMGAYGGGYVDPVIVNVGGGTENAPMVFSLAQNYPNPFNPGTHIAFTLPQTVEVSLRIYNLLGQLVATPIDRQVMQQGAHTISFDGSSLASGVYLFRIDAGAFTGLRKMTLLK